MRPPTPACSSIRSILILALGLALGIPTPAVAISPASAAAGSSPQRLTAELRELLEPGTVTSAVRATGKLAGVPPSVEGAPEVPSTPDEAVETIVEAAARADRIARSGAPTDRQLTAGRGVRFALRAAADPAAYADVAPADPTTALRAAAVLGRAIDASLPVLRSVQPSPNDGGDAVACDMFDNQDVCVGGAGANSYDQWRRVIIDLGGNDSYTAPSLGAGLGATLILDVAGDDTYATTDGYGLGYGMLGGVGMVVDGAGNDFYRLASTSGPVGGIAVGFFGGAGFLVDGSGDDRYEMESTVEGGDAGAAGQSQGFFGGVSALVDGGGNDQHVSTVTSLPKSVEIQNENGTTKQMTRYGTAAATLHGAGGFGGVALLSQSGGNDVFRNVSKVAPAPPDIPIQVDEETVPPYALAGGQANTILAGAGVLLEGPGNTRYEFDVELGPAPVTSPETYARVLGQGMADGNVSGAPSDAQGILSDAGGDDVYSVSVSLATSAHLEARDGCACSAVTAEAGSPFAMTQGFGANGGQGLLEDHGGNDLYSAEVSSTSEATVDDQRTEAGPRLAAIARAPAPILVAQGAGEALGEGVLRDAAGNDGYRAVATSLATADGQSTVPANAPALSAVTGNPAATVQGAARLTAGSGLLADLAGSDKFEAVASATTIQGGQAESLPAAIYAQGAINPNGQAGSSAGLIDIDGVGTDTFSQTPPLPACSGTRGQGVWTDCTNGGFGVNS